MTRLSSSLRAIAVTLMYGLLMPALPCHSAEPANTGHEAALPESVATAYEIGVRVVDDQGAPVAGAQVGAMSIDQMVVDTRTDAEGRATLRVTFSSPLETIWAAQPGVGVDYLAIVDEETEEEVEEEQEKLPANDHALRLPQELRELKQPLELVLNGTRDVTVKVVDEDTGQPLADSLVIPWYVYKPGKAAEFNVSGLREFARNTDEHGIARVDVVPIDNAIATPLLVRSQGYVAHEVFTFRPGAEAAEITAGLIRLVSVTGRVLESDGQPAAGATVLAAGDGYHYGYFRASAETRDDGTFEVEVSPQEYYSLAAQKENQVSRVDNFIVRKGEPVAGLEITLQPGTRLHGRVTVGPESQPLPDYPLRLCQQPAREYPTVSPEERLPNPHETRDYIQPILERTTRTDAHGGFEFFVGPGRYYLVGPTSAPVPRFTVADEEAMEINLAARDAE